MKVIRKGKIAYINENDEKVARAYWKLRNEDLHNLYFSS
jgi:hypothetical protein